MEQLSPVRIVVGYSGYRSEFSFRRAFTHFLHKNVFRRGFGAGSLPQLLICGKYSLLKLNGHPYSVPMQGERWPIITSSSENPVIFLLELIWNRLSQHLPMPEWFADDLSMERATLFLSCRALRRHGRAGWEYWEHAASKKSLETQVPPREWQPFVVTLSQFIIMNELCRRESLPIDDPLLVGLSQQDKEGLKELFQKRLVAQDGKKLVLLTQHCECVIMPTGDYVVGDNSGGRMVAWVLRQPRKRRQAGSE